MLGIPSPDVVVNLFASLGQLLAVLSILVGGAAVSVKRKDRRSRSSATSRGLLFATSGLALASVVAFTLYYGHVQDLRNARLRANLTRPSVEAGKPTRDDDLVTLSFGEQLGHAAGMSTTELKAALANGDPLNIIDIRESEEVEAGRIPGATATRYPDLKETRKGLIKPGYQTLLVCYSGNRSSELTDTFIGKGVACKFLIGGYEKWISDGGALDLGTANSRSTLRELPQVPGSDVLLDTPDVSRLVKERDAIFVDVRYDEEFDAGHLPGAIQLPIRKLRTEELARRLAELPHKPIIAPCYDKRSSFYASILGVKLHRLGYEFLGRYTVPHEFFVATKKRAHVAAWEAAQAAATPFGMIEKWLTTALAWLRDWCGSLALAILLLVLLVRGGLSPFSFKADLDQFRRQLLAPKIQQLRAEFPDDPARVQRRTMALYRGIRMTPVRNLLVSVGQLILFLAFFGVVREAAKGSTEVLGPWTLGQEDGTRVLPILVGVLMGLIVLNGPRSTRKLVLAGVLVVGLAALTWTIEAAGNLYLVTSLVWVAVQGRIARRVVTGPKRLSSEQLQGMGVVTFLDAARTPNAGNKAIRLGAMLEAGLPVPNGFSLTDVALRRASREGHLAEQDRTRILKLHRALKSDRVAVRSSGLKEDGEDKSYAGVFESVLDVTRDGLFDAIEFVRKSMDSDRARAYGDGDETGGIVIQSMVRAEYAGVMFTEHPGKAGATMIEMVEGLCEQLVGGSVTPKAFEFTRVSGRLIGKDRPKIDLAPLLALGRRIEELFDAPQDIEWAYAKGRFYILQSRDITVSAGSGDSLEALRQREQSRLLRIAREAALDDVVFAQNELSELLPDPTPFSIGFMNSLWAPGGSVDLACQSMGIPYAVSENCNDYVVDVFGKLFVDRREEARRLSAGMGGMASFRLTRGADALEQEFRQVQMPAFHKRLRVMEATDVTRLRDADLFDLWRDVREQFVTETYVEAERINIAADFYVKTATEQLQRKGLNPAAALANIPQTVVNRAYRLLPDIQSGKVQIEAFLDLFGHRASHDFEFAEPRYSDNPAAVSELAGRTHGAGHVKHRQDPKFGRVLAIAVDRARRFQALKEEAKHEAMRELAFFRTLTLEIGRRLGLGRRVLWLTPDEVDALEMTRVDGGVERLIDDRLASREAFETVELPTRLTLEHLESMFRDDRTVVLPRPGAGETLVGQRVAGDKEVVGTVRVVRDVAELVDFQPGEILVARFTDPTWSTVFATAGGLITEVGGWLSHAAIQAREYGLACIVDVDDARAILETGETVRLGLDGSIERLTETDASGKIIPFGAARAGVEPTQTAKDSRKSAQ